MARRPPWICSFPRAPAAALPQPSLTSLRQRRVRGASSQPAALIAAQTPSAPLVKATQGWGARLSP